MTNFSHQNMSKGNTKQQILYYGKVIDNIDLTESKRIKVRIEGLDDELNDDQLPFSFPILPKNFSVMPKVNELVVIIIADSGSKIQDRFYFGSLIPQNDKMNFSDVLYASSALNTGKTPLNIASNKIPEAIGVYGQTDDVIIEGRNNAEIKFNTGQILLRTGKHTLERVQNVPLLNNVNQTYIQMKHNVSLFGSDKTFSVLNLVSDKINLLTHENGSPMFNLNGGEEPISDEAMIDILKNAHPLAFGDILVEYLNLMRNVLLNHVHPYNGMKASNLNGEDSIQKLLDFDLKALLSKNIKIN